MNKGKVEKGLRRTERIIEDLRGSERIMEDLRRSERDIEDLLGGERMVEHSRRSKRAIEDLRGSERMVGDLRTEARSVFDRYTKAASEFGGTLRLFDRIFSVEQGLARSAASSGQIREERSLFVHLLLHALLTDFVAALDAAAPVFHGSGKVRARWREKLLKEFMSRLRGTRGKSQQRLDNLRAAPGAPKGPRPLKVEEMLALVLHDDFIAAGVSMTEAAERVRCSPHRNVSDLFKKNRDGTTALRRLRDLRKRLEKQVSDQAAALREFRQTYADQDSRKPSGLGTATVEPKR